MGFCFVPVQGKSMNPRNSGDFFPPVRQLEFVLRCSNDMTVLLQLPDCNARSFTSSTLRKAMEQTIASLNGYAEEYNITEVRCHVHFDFDFEIHICLHRISSFELVAQSHELLRYGR
jgi:hypothetical protein